MNVTETSVEGLRRQLKVVIGAAELEQRLSARLDELKGRARIKGFRPGRVPKEHLRQVYGRPVMAPVVQHAAAAPPRAALSPGGSRASPARAARPRVRQSSSAGAISSPASRRGLPALVPARNARSMRPSPRIIRKRVLPARRRASP